MKQHISLFYKQILLQLLIGMNHPHYAEQYIINCLAGDGGQGQAYLCHSQGQFYIIKTYHDPIQGLKYYTKEVEIMSRINSPHIVHMVEHFREGRIRLGEQQERMPFVVLQFAQHGQLFKIVNQGKLHEDVCRTLFKQLIAALKHLSQLQIAHRDIKLQNILLDKDFNIKLADFGYACSSRGELNDFCLRSYQGTKGYIAPQIINKTYRGEKIDLFAAGIVLFLMFVRIPPFQSTFKNDSRYNLIRGERYQQFWALFQRKGRLPNDFKRLISALVSSYPEKRPTFAQLEQDLWMNGPVLSNEELIAYMQPRYERLAQGDQQTITIRSQFGQNLQRFIDQRQNPDRERSRDDRDNRHPSSSGGSRGSGEVIKESITNNQLDICGDNEGKGQDISGNIKMSKFEDILVLDFHHFTLPIQNIFKAVYVKASPKLVLCWLRHCLSVAYQKKQIFLPENQWEIQPKQFQMNFTKQGIIHLDLKFQMNENNDITETSVQIKGQMVLWEESIGVSWRGIEGHQFWLSGIISQLSSRMRVFFN